MEVLIFCVNIIINPRKPPSQALVYRGPHRNIWKRQNTL